MPFLVPFVLPLSHLYTFFWIDINNKKLHIFIVSHIFYLNYLSTSVLTGKFFSHYEIFLQNLQLKIKWPNDIYYGRMYKMGGLLVNASTIGDKTVCTLGNFLNQSSIGENMTLF